MSSTAADSSSGEPPELCGNGVIDEGEVCDGEALPPDADCATEGFGEGTPSCVDDCSTLDYAGCPEMLCGNGKVGLGEECDGMNLSGGTCDDFPNLTGDGLACSECLYDTNDCQACVESDDPCEPTGEPCCNAPGEACIGLLGNKRCCVGNGLGGCA